MTLGPIGRRCARSPFLWRWGLNFPRTLRQALHRRAVPAARARAEELRSRGICVGRLEEIADEAGVRCLEEVIRLSVEEVRALAPNGLPVAAESSRKDYVHHLFHTELRPESPMVRFALQPGLLEVAAGYLGLWPVLHSLFVWANFPTPGPARETQLWHQDDDDLLNVKVFVYLNDVGPENGPFCFIPETHPPGRLQIRPERDKDGRVSDEEMERAVPRACWKTCTAPARTVIFADTCGWHRGLKPVSGHRIMLMIQYTSATPNYPRGLRIAGDASPPLLPIQRMALFPPRIRPRNQ